MWSRQEPTLRILAILVGLMIMLVGLGGCLQGGSSNYSNLKRDLDVQMERALATDHIWFSDRPKTLLNESQIFLFCYIRLLNTGDGDLSLDGLLFFVDFPEGWDMWTPSLLFYMGISLDADPRFVEGLLDTRAMTIPPGGSMAGWTMFTTDNSTLKESWMRVRLTYIIDDNPVLRKKFSLDDVEEDWSIPIMLTVDSGDLVYTNWHRDLRANRFEKILIANLSLANNWPVQTRLDVEGINLTVDEGIVHSPDMVRSLGLDDLGILEFAGTTSLEVSFLLDRDTVPTLINLLEDVTYSIDPAVIVEAYLPCRLDVAPNFVSVEETDSERRYRFNVTLNNNSDDVVYLHPVRLRLLDSGGIYHDRYKYWDPPETELEVLYLGPGEGVTGVIEYRLPLDLVPTALDYDDEGRYVEVPIAGLKVITP